MPNEDGRLIHAIVAAQAKPFSPPNTPPTILAEHSSSHASGSHATSSGPSFAQASQTILSKIPGNDSKLTYSSDTYLWHFVSQDGLITLVMADDSLGRRTPFAFLAEMRKRFLTQYSREQISEAGAFSMNGFSREIARLMDRFHTSPPHDPIKQAQSDLADVKGVMVKNVEAILSRGERLDLLIDKTDQMSSQARQFRKRSAVLRRKMWWKNTKLMILTAVVIVLLIYLFAAAACGVGLNHC